MFYWNKENFTGLREIGEKYSKRDNYEAFANYCILKEKGLKKEALKSIEAFISAVKFKSDEEQRAIAEELGFLSYHNKSIHQLIPHPLQQFLLKIFKNWVEKDNKDAVPYRWLGHFSNDIINYEKAFEIDPDDEITITELAKFSLSYVDHQTHHLSESVFIGNLSDASKSLDKAAIYIEKLKPVFVN